MGLLRERLISRETELEPLQSTNTLELCSWADSYNRRGPARRSALQCFAIGLYQLGQGQGWSGEKATRAESCASAVLWWLQCASRMGAAVEQDLPADLRTVPTQFPGWEAAFAAIARAQQQVFYGTSCNFSGRNSRFSTDRLRPSLAACIFIAMSYADPEYRAGGFLEGTSTLLGRG